MSRNFFAIAALFLSNSIFAQYNMEYLTRGVHAVPDSNGKVFVSWRLLGTEDPSLAFNVYRTTSGKTVKLNKTPVTNVTGYTDELADCSQPNT